MAKKKPDEIKKSDNQKSFSSFLKKRAPIYLGIIGLFMIFAYPALTEKNLESLLPDYFEGDEKKAIELIKSYNGANEQGMTILQVIENTLLEKYPDEKIFDDEETSADWIITNLVDKESEFTHEIVFVFDANGDTMSYGWYINVDTSELSPIDTDSRKVQQTVDYFD